MIILTYFFGPPTAELDTYIDPHNRLIIVKMLYAFLLNLGLNPVLSLELHAFELYVKYGVSNHYAGTQVSDRCSLGYLFCLAVCCIVHCKM